ncbi:hypothetical protein X777_05497, partial [Ooceraea biroi]
KKSEEDVVTYANRVKVLGKQILEAYRSSGSLQSDPNVKISLEKDMAKCFIRGLKPEIEQRIARDLDVQATIADALRIERELHAMTDLRKRCQICSKPGHSAKTCDPIRKTAREFL